MMAVCRRRVKTADIFILVLFFFFGNIGLWILQESSVQSLCDSSQPTLENIAVQRQNFYRNMSQFFTEIVPNIIFNESVRATSSKTLLRSTNESYVIERMKRYNSACIGKEFFYGAESDRNMRFHYQVSQAYKLIYCSVEKAGTTFWRRILQVLDSSNIDNPYAIKPLNVNQRSRHFYKEDFFRMLAKIRTHAIFMFVRDPYSRLLAGYLDKIYSANPFYWDLVGRETGPYIPYINAQNREEASARTCYHNITFEEFIDYVIKAEGRYNKRRDVHFMAMHDLCKPCQLQYDFIGKMETFKKDFHFLLQTLNIKKFNHILKDMEERSLDDNILDIATSLHERRTKILKCMTMHEAYLRSWRRLQIKGIIDLKQKYPFNEKESEKLSPINLVNAIKSANRKSRRRDILKRQKEVFFSSIYSTVPIEKIEKLAVVFKRDFEIFDYNPQPVSIFLNRKDNVKYSDIFSVT